MSHIIERLVKNRTWGGNYLPDFGPRADGTMSPKYYAACDEMAAWMKYGEVSVYNVESGPYPEQCDVPVTVRGDVWYVHFLAPRQPANLKVTHEPKSARVLRTGAAANWKRDRERLILTLPQAPPTDLDEVVEVRW